MARMMEKHLTKRSEKSYNQVSEMSRNYAYITNDRRAMANIFYQISTSNITIVKCDNIEYNTFLNCTASNYLFDVS